MIVFRNTAATGDRSRARQGDRIVHGHSAGGGLERERTSVSAYGCGKNRQFEARLKHLVLHDLVTGPEGFEPIAGSRVFAHGDAGLSCEVLQLGRVKGPVEDDASFSWAGCVSE